MTDLADGVVYSRSGLTYQAGLLEKAGLITRSSSPDDERSVTVTITDAGRALVARLLPGHVEIVSRLLFEPLDRGRPALTSVLIPRARPHARDAARSAAPRRRGTARRPAAARRIGRSRARTPPQPVRTRATCSPTRSR